jgi:DNA-binding response OmpR family regulator
MWPFSLSKEQISISQIAIPYPREQLIKNSRIVIIDDEEPQLKQDLEQRGFAVTYAKDIEMNLQQQIESGIYDLIILDFAGVGTSIGPEEGLSILRHVRRVSPAVIILAYTSKALDSSKADFYRLTDGVLSKDSGIGESQEKVEDALRKAHSPSNLWKALVNKLGITPGSEQEKDLEKRFLASHSNKNKKTQLQAFLENAVTDENAQKAVSSIAAKLLAMLGI